MINPVGTTILIALVPLHLFGIFYLFREYRKHVRFYKEAKVTDGIVVSAKKYSSGDSPDYCARVSYTVDGVQYKLKDEIWTEARSYEKGQVVKIYYLPDSPDSSRIADPLAPVIYLTGALLIVGVIVIIFVTLLKNI